MTQAVCHAQVLVLRCNEATKSLAQVERVCRAARGVSLSRTGLLVGFGGGVCTDITSVAASWLRRGTHQIRVPTTLIGQVDAGVGLKGAVNFEGVKSYIGCYHAPELVLVAPRFLSSLSTRHLQQGFAEVVKIAVVCNLPLLELVERHAQELVRTGFQSSQAPGPAMIWEAAVNMLSELAKNPYEDQTYERLVDFGHTLSPILESASGYRMTHGEAVALDIALSTAISSELGLLNPTFRDRLLRVLNLLHLPLYSPLVTYELCQQALHHAALHRGGRPNLVLPADGGQVVYVHSPEVISVGAFVRAVEVLASCRQLEAQG